MERFYQTFNIHHFDARSNGGRESIKRLPSGVDSGDLLHSRQTKRRQTCSRPCNKDGRHRQDAAAQSASLSEVTGTLLRVADRLSSMQETSSPSKYRATFVKYGEVMCSRRHKVTCSASFISFILITSRALCTERHRS